MTGQTATRFLKTLDGLQAGALELVTPEGKTHVFGGRQPGATSRLEVRDWRVLDYVLRRGDTGFAEAYKAGLWETDRLPDLLTLALQNDQVIARYLFGARITQMAAHFFNLFRRNTVAGSRRNIHAHYDLGNEFYALWLDPTMTYSSALYGDGHNLMAAQHNKYDRMIDQLGEPSGRLLEIGCGWGGFAERAVTRGDFDVRGITISKAQHDFAQGRLGERATIAMTDYRHQTGRFDHIVSIEMFEAVGQEYWATYFNKIKELLSAKGRAVVQTITIGEPYFDRYQRGTDFIRNYIFPGGMLPTVSAFDRAAGAAGLAPHTHHHFGADYARTLEEWLGRFDAVRDRVLAMGFDAAFIRLWRFYLAACIAGFRTGRINVMQVTMQHA